ncbi:MAG: universal stress protein [Cyclobacteriaceae bacterium]
MKVILASTDFSETGNNAVKYAINFASAIKCNLIVFHAVHAPAIPPTMTPAEYRVLERNTERFTQRMLDLVVDKLYSEVKQKRYAQKVKTLAKNGIFVIDTVLSAAKQNSADLIVVGTHGATGLKLLGSITSEIIFKATVPVLSVPPDIKFKKIASVLYSSDLMNLGPELKNILPIATTLKAGLEIVHFANRDEQNEAKAFLAQAIRKVSYKKVKAIVINSAGQGTLIKHLQEYVNKKKPQILVLFPGERNFIDKLFVKSKTERLTYVSKLPLLSIRKSIVS